MIALLGNLARDLFPGRPPHVGGAPFHAARALRELHVPARIFARCSLDDRDELLPPVVALGTPVTYVPGVSTAVFEIASDGDRRAMRIDALGDVWRPEDVPSLPDSVRWVHVAPLARSDFPAETLAAIARGRRILLDGQGLVRPARLGELVLDGDYDPAVLEHVWTLKVSDDEAAVLGDPALLPVREVLVTHGSKGATLYTAGRVERVPAFPIPVPEPTGAGDGFSVSYVAGRAAGLSPAAAARRATAVIASVLSAE